jgi:hypothetical protein
MEMVLSNRNSDQVMVCADTEFERSWLEKMDGEIFKGRIKHGLNNEVMGLMLEEQEVVVPQLPLKLADALRSTHSRPDLHSESFFQGAEAMYKLLQSGLQK